MAWKMWRPLNGWRALAGEVGVIVLGVLIALGAQQVVDELQWRREVAATRAALADEIGINVANAAERHMVNACLRDRLADLLKLVRSDVPRWRGTVDRLKYRTYTENFRDFPTVYRAPYLNWPSDVWDATKSSTTVNHLRRDEVIGLANLYSSFERLKALQMQEQEIFPELIHLGFDQTLDADARRRVIAQIGRLHWANQIIIEDSDDAFEKVRALRGSIGTIDLSEQLKERMRKQSGFRGACVKPFRTTGI